MKCKYAYSIATVFLTDFSFIGKQDLKLPEAQDSITESINENLQLIIRDLEVEDVEEPFEIKSHTISFVENDIVLSFLVQTDRPKQVS